MPGVSPAQAAEAGSLFVAASLLIAYEVVRAWRSHSRSGSASHAHTRLREGWMRTLAGEPGFEIVAVQALRNLLMSATISASSAALALMGSATAVLTYMGTQAGGITAMSASRTALLALVFALLFLSYTCSALSMRYYSYVTIIASMPARCAQKKDADLIARLYIERAGRLYGWGLRTVLYLAPLLVALALPLLAGPCALALLLVLHLFDAAPGSAAAPA